MTEQDYIKSIAVANMNERGIVNSFFNKEILSNRPTHFDNSKGVKIKAFSDTIFDTILGNSCTAEIMEGHDTGKWTTCFFMNLQRLQ